MPAYSPLTSTAALNTISVTLPLNHIQMYISHSQASHKLCHLWCMGFCQHCKHNFLVLHKCLDFSQGMNTVLERKSYLGCLVYCPKISLWCHYQSTLPSLNCSMVNFNNAIPRWSVCTAQHTVYIPWLHMLVNYLLLKHGQVSESIFVGGFCSPITCDKCAITDFVISASRFNHIANLQVTSL